MPSSTFSIILRILGRYRLFNTILNLFGFQNISSSIISNPFFVSMSVYLIAAIAKNGVIALDSHPFTSMNSTWFRMNTFHGAVIMDQDYWESLPTALCNSCTNFVVRRSTSKSEQVLTRGTTSPPRFDGPHWCETLTEALFLSSSSPTYIIGGSELFHSALLLDVVDAFLITHVDIEIPDHRPREWSLPSNRKVVWTSKNHHHHHFHYHFELSCFKKRG